MHTLEEFNRVQQKSQDGYGHHIIRANHIMNCMVHAQKHIQIEAWTKWQIFFRRNYQVQMTAIQLWFANDMLSNREQAITLTKNGHVRWNIKLCKDCSLSWRYITPSHLTTHKCLKWFRKGKQEVVASFVGMIVSMVHINKMPLICMSLPICSAVVNYHNVIVIPWCNGMMLRRRWRVGVLKIRCRKTDHQGPLLLIWIYFNPSMEK